MKIKIFVLAFIAVSILLCVSCGKKAASRNDTAIEVTKDTITKAMNGDAPDYAAYRIQYKNPVNGFKVSVAFYPEWYDESDKTLHGSAMFEFISPKGIRDTMISILGTYFHVNSFPELAELFENEKYHDCKNLPKLSEEKVFYLDYKEPVIKDDFGLNDFDVPFYFADVNFDGEKDLLIPMTNMFYDCKILTNGEINGTIWDRLSDADIIFDLKYDTRIDRKNREIIIYNGYTGGDYCHTAYEFYKFNSKGEVYQSKAQYNNLKNSEGFLTDSTLISTYQYEWDNGIWTYKGKEEKIVINER